MAGYRIGGSMLLFMLGLGMFCTPYAEGEDPWADEVISYTPGSNALMKDPSKALGAPLGGGPSTPNNTSLVSLGGPGGELVLKFNTPVTDDLRNPMGLDCIVYSNAFWPAGNSQSRFEEPAIIEISDDVNGNGLPDHPGYLIPGSRAFPYNPFPSLAEPNGQGNSQDAPLILAGVIRNPNLFDEDPSNDKREYNWGYAELSPTMLPYRDNYVRPDDPFTVGLTPATGGGDAFDIAWAVDENNQPVHLKQFVFIRLHSFISRNFGAMGTASPEIDAVADVAPEVDTDGDGILDEYESRVAGTDPLRPESTVLPLEIPAIEGGSPAGTLLGEAKDSRGTVLRLYSAGTRSDDNRAFSTNIDITASAEPGAVLPTGGWLKSGVVRLITSSQTDFEEVGIQSAEVVLPYTAADIVGLDEPSLTPFLLQNGNYVQIGISDVDVNTNTNVVTFRTRYAGLFLLASKPGAGDVGGTDGPQGTIVLTATPEHEIEVGSNNMVTVASSIIHDKDENPVPDGTLITVASSLGTINAVDADLNIAGTQVPTANGIIAFVLHAPQRAGTTFITAASVVGSAYGSLNYTFVPAPPGDTVTWTIDKPYGDHPVMVPLTSNTVRDRFGNVVRDGALVTITVDNGVIVSTDADVAVPGFQAVVRDGLLMLSVEAEDTSTVFTVTTFADVARTHMLGQSECAADRYVPVPLHHILLVLTLGTFALWRLRRRLS